MKESKEIPFEPHCVDSTRPENLISYTNIEVDYYIDEHYVPNLSEYTVTNPSSVKLRVTAYYNGGTMTHNYVIATYETTN